MTSQPSPTTVTVAEYLARRLHAAGVRHLFGVPGDFTLALNDALAATGLLEWVGTAGELGAGYAADGYARRRGLGAVMTTYGVGELSCLGAVAGAYAENVPVLQITGAPPTSAAASGALLHHTLADGDFGHFERAYREVTVASEVLTPDGAAEQIDRVLEAVLTHRRPGYLSVPADLVAVPVDATRLDRPLGACALGSGLPASGLPGATLPGTVRPALPAGADPAVVAAFVAAARRLLAAPGRARPVVVAGPGVRQARAEAALRALAERADLPVVALVSAKGVLDEDHPAYRGLYLGGLGDAGPRALVEEAGVLITVGAVWSDVVAGLFTHRSDPASTIALDLRSATVAGEVFDGVGPAEALGALTDTWASLPPRLPSHEAGSRTVGTGGGDNVVVTAGSGSGPASDGAGAPGPAAWLTQAQLWQVVQDRLPARCTLVTDIGTAFWGAAGITFPPDTVHVAQPLWSAIGYALPATLGVGLAEPDRLPVLVTGEGAAMMTVQELGTLAARVPGAVVVVIDNGGYAIERVLRSPDAAHHDVARWDWTALARAMAPDAEPLTRRATTAAELGAALDDAFAEARSEKPRLSVVQVVTGPTDAPRLLRALAEAVRR